jgi:hypothetical protein
MILRTVIVKLIHIDYTVRSRVNNHTSFTLPLHFFHTSLSRALKSLSRFLQGCYVSDLLVEWGDENVRVRVQVTEKVRETYCTYDSSVRAHREMTTECKPCIYSSLW